MKNLIKFIGSTVLFLSSSINFAETGVIPNSPQDKAIKCSLSWASKNPELALTKDSTTLSQDTLGNWVCNFND